jgi:hypothetical protein
VDKHEIMMAVKQMASELGRTPTKAEFSSRVSERQIDRLFRNYSILLQAAGLDTYSTRRKKGQSAFSEGFQEGKITKEEKLLKKYQSICAKKEQIQGFYRHVIDLKDLFERAGHPKSLKVSAQPDTHAKYRDEKAYRCYIKFLEYYQPDVHIIMGDFADCEGLSHWPGESLEPRRIVPEMKLCRAMLKEIVEATPKCSTRIFLEGNHERWIQMAMTNMPELFDGLEELELDINVQKLLALEKFNYQFFPLNDLVQIGKAHFTHGIYTQTHHAAKHLHEFKTNIYYGHLHDTQESNNTNIDGPLEASSLGCLCRLDAKFLKGKKTIGYTLTVFRIFSRRQLYISET